MLREVIGSRIYEMEIEDKNTIKDVITKLVYQFPPLLQFLLTENSEFNSNILLIVNGSQKIDTSYILQEGDELALVPPSGGG